MENRYDAFTNTISSIYQSIQKIRAYEMEKFGLQTGHATCLHHLYRNPDGLTQKELAALCDMDKAAISRYVAILRDKGFAEERGLSDKRYNLKICLTESGIKAARETSQRIIQAVAGGATEMSEDERSAFYKNLFQIADNLQTYYKELEK